jgi:hypothetical protein
LIHPIFLILLIGYYLAVLVPGLAAALMRFMRRRS